MVNSRIKEQQLRSNKSSKLFSCLSFCSRASETSLKDIFQSNAFGTQKTKNKYDYTLNESTQSQSPPLPPHPFHPSPPGR